MNERGDGDRRVVKIAITDKARAITLQVFGPVRRSAAGRLAAYKASEIDLVIRFMKDLSEILSGAGSVSARS
jgi:hypothetical protein